MLRNNLLRWNLFFLHSLRPYIHAIAGQLAIRINFFYILSTTLGRFIGHSLCANIVPRYPALFIINVYVDVFLCCVQVCGRPLVLPVKNSVFFIKSRKPALFHKYKNTPFLTFVTCNHGLLMAYLQVGSPRVNGH